MPTLTDAAADQPKFAEFAQAAAGEPAGPRAEVPADTTGDEPARAAPPNSPPIGDTGSLERMGRLRHLVRVAGMDAQAAAQEVGVDPIIAQLWLRLPDDLWPAARTGTDSGTASNPRPTLQPPAMPAGGLRRVITARVPAPAYERLRSGEAPIIEAAVRALEAGLSQPRPAVGPGGWRFARRPIAVPVPSEAYGAILQLAHDSFGGDPRDAAGWLIARGLGMMLPLPTPEELAGAPPAPVATAPEKLTPPPARFVVPPRRRPEARAPLPPDDSAPSGDELRQRREALGLSQRDLAAASGLSRGLVAEVERGRRRHVLTRLRLSETLASLERGRPATVGL